MAPFEVILDDLLVFLKPEYILADGLTVLLLVCLALGSAEGNLDS